MISLNSTYLEPETTKVTVLGRESERYTECVDDSKDAETERNDSTDVSDLTANSPPSLYNDSVQMLEELREEEMEESDFSDSDRSLSEETYSSSSCDPCDSSKRSTKHDIIHYLRKKLNVMTTKYSKLKTQ